MFALRIAHSGAFLRLVTVLVLGAVLANGGLTGAGKALILFFFLCLLGGLLLLSQQFLVPVQLLLDQPQDERLLGHLVAFQVPLDPLKKALRHLERQGSHVLHFLSLHFRYFGM